MNKSLNQNIVWVSILAVIVLGSYWLFGGMDSGVLSGEATTSPSAPNTIMGIQDNMNPTAKPVAVSAPKPSVGANFKDYMSATYVFQGNATSLVNGKSASGKTEIVPGIEASGDLNGDKIYDAAFVIRQTIDGGTFYYVATAIKNNNGYRVTNTILLGQDIVPLNIGIGTGDIVINYLDRDPGESITAKPTAPREKYFKVVGGILRLR